MERFDGGFAYVHGFKIPFSELDKVDFATCKEPRETLASYYDRQSIKPDILTNGGFFEMSSGLPCMSLEDENVIKAYDAEVKYGIGITKDNRIVYGSIDDETNGLIDYRDFISGYPTLVVDGKPATITYGAEISSANPRTAIGIDDNNFYIVTVDGRQLGKPGMSFRSLTTLLINFGCKYAINLDGGGSARMLYKGKVENSPTENRPVDNVVAVYFKPSNPTPTPVINTPTGTDRIYTVVSGDSFWKIAQENMGNGMRYTTLASYNGLKTSSTLTTGQTLKIPYEYDTKKTTTPDNSSVNDDSTKQKPLYTTYVVRYGDSLWGIAQKTLGNGSLYPTIMEANGMTKPNIYKNQILKIPV